jgi:hypothetical protein
MISRNNEIKSVDESHQQQSSRPQLHQVDAGELPKRRALDRKIGEREIEPLAISVVRASAQLNLGKTKLYAMMAEGSLTRAKVGRRRSLHSKVLSV